MTRVGGVHVLVGSSSINFTGWSGSVPVSFSIKAPFSGVGLQLIRVGGDYLCVFGPLYNRLISESFIGVGRQVHI